MIKKPRKTASSSSFPSLLDHFVDCNVRTPARDRRGRAPFARCLASSRQQAANRHAPVATTTETAAAAAAVTVACYPGFCSPRARALRNERSGVWTRDTHTPCPPHVWRATHGEKFEKMGASLVVGCCPAHGCERPSPTGATIHITIHCAPASPVVVVVVVLAESTAADSEVVADCERRGTRATKLPYTGLFGTVRLPRIH